MTSTNSTHPLFLPPTERFELMRTVDGESGTIAVGKLTNTLTQVVRYVGGVTVRSYRGQASSVVDAVESAIRKITQLNILPGSTVHLNLCVGFTSEHFFFEVGKSSEEYLNRPGNDRTHPIFEKIARGVCNAVAFLHKHDLAHGDLHPAHVLIGSVDEAVKLIDFKTLQTKNAPVAIHTNRHFYFAPPEAWLCAATGFSTIPDAPADLAFKGDIYQLGLLVLLCLNPTALPNHLYEDITKEGWYEPSVAMEHFQYMLTCYEETSLTAFGFLSLNPEDRITAEKALELFLQLKNFTLAPEPECDFKRDLRDIGAGSYKTCEFGTIQLKGKVVSIAKITTKNSVSYSHARRERYNLWRMNQVFGSNRYFSTLHVLGNRVAYVDPGQCDLEDVISEDKNKLTGRSYTVEEKHKLFVDVLTSVTLLHDAGLIHRDIKAGNCIVIECSVKLTDFGGVEKVTSAPPRVSEDSFTLGAPETIRAVFNNETYYPAGYSLYADEAWRTGLIALELLCPRSRFPSFESWGKMETYLRAIRELRNGSVCAKFKGLLEEDPKNRSSVKSVLAGYKKPIPRLGMV